MSSSTAFPQNRVEELTALAKAKTFMGREFLTWLWYFIDAEGGKFSLKHDDHTSPLAIDLWVDDRLVLESQNAKAHESVMKGGDPSQSVEASWALRQGKTVKEMKLGLNADGIGEFSAVLNAQDLNPRALKLPAGDKPENITDPDEPPVLTRLRYTETFLMILDGLFTKFLEERVGDGWDKAGLTAIRAWVKDHGLAAEKTLH